jgi:hypothetical protein
MGAEELIE